MGLDFTGIGAFADLAGKIIDKIFLIKMLLRKQSWICLNYSKRELLRNSNKSMLLLSTD